MIWIEKAVYVQDYLIQVKFNNGEEGILDMMPVLENDKRKIFDELLDLGKFRRFRVDMDTIVWENGLDLAPEFIKDRIKLMVAK